MNKIWRKFNILFVKFWQKIHKANKLSRRQILLFTGLGVVLAIFSALFLLPQIQSYNQKQAYIQNIVDKAKAGIEFPVKLDEITTWQSVEAANSKIIYTYTLSEFNNSRDTNTLISANVTAAICQNQESLEILEQEVTLEFVYNLSDQSKIVKSLTRKDCN